MDRLINSALEYFHGKSSTQKKLQEIFRPSIESIPTITTIKDNEPPKHWQHLSPDRDHEYKGTVYDHNIVKRVFPDEVYGWEHEKTTPSLVYMAEQDNWEENASPPISLAYSQEGVKVHGKTCHYAISDGHHRLNACTEVNRKLPEFAKKGIPAIVNGEWFSENGSYVGYRSMPFTTRDESLNTEWNPQKIPQKMVFMESTRLVMAHRKEVQVSLKGTRKNESIKVVAQILDKEIPLNEFLKPEGEDSLLINISTETFNKSYKEISSNNISIKNIDLNAKNWHDILQIENSNQTLLLDWLADYAKQKDCQSIYVKIVQSNARCF